ncbi:alpha/beta hydrolase family protein [Methanobacterium oryzae]|uniref:alpha/beta hydrolase family protein n=1 Tax=Methanobacterium oryzae TaxID=69540 RepID=UPI003D207468
MNKDEKGYTAIILKTRRGDITCRFYSLNETNLGAIYVGGIGGGFDTPANDLYPYLGEKLKLRGISSLRIRFRNSRSVEESVYDVLAGIKFLESEGINKIALVGHSLGGAVVIQAAALSKSIKTVITLATQSYGAENVSNIPSDSSILLIHGLDDPVLSSYCSKQVFDIAHDPKQIITLPGNGHCLDESSEDVHEIVYNWILNELSK